MVCILGIGTTALIKWVGMAYQGTFGKNMNVCIYHLVDHHGCHDEQQNAGKYGCSFIFQYLIHPATKKLNSPVSGNT